MLYSVHPWSQANSQRGRRSCFGVTGAQGMGRGVSSDAQHTSSPGGLIVSLSNLTALKNKDSTDAYAYGTVCINCSGVESKLNAALTLLDGDRRLSDGPACTSSGSTLLRAASRLGGGPVVPHGTVFGRSNAGSSRTQ